MRVHESLVAVVLVLVWELAPPTHALLLSLTTIY
jgi:hypothetical protein